MRENGGWINYSMIEVEKYPCRDENEATARERHWFEILNSSLNTNVPNRSHQECNRQYYAGNRDNILIQNRQYKSDNRDNILIQKKQYNEDHRAEIATRRKQTFTCECGGIITVRNKSRHFITKFHLQYMERIPVVQSQVVPPITDTQLSRGICYIPLAQFENIKQQEEINDDHFYFSNHYDYMYQH
jgi:hypothetical protein